MRLALAARVTGAGHRLGALEWRGGVTPPTNASLARSQAQIVAQRDPVLKP